MKYRQYRNLLKNAISVKYEQYLVRESSEITKNPKRAWNLIHTKTKTKRLPNLMYSDGKKVSEPLQIANLYND